MRSIRFENEKTWLFPSTLPIFFVFFVGVLNASTVRRELTVGKND